jgi:3-deoxy-D-manno-octulosonate 8-phosphate phosphatase (KDO 8-P phosphatase)
VIRALVLDVDGVLTDGGVILDGGEGETKRFHARDGVGIKLAQTAGWRVLFLTARHSPPARRRAEELGAEWAMGVAAKERYLERWLAAAAIPWSDVAFMGDDLQDLPVLRRVGWPLAVADAVLEVRNAARHVTERTGGSGAVREAVEWLLEQEHRRESTVETFLSRSEGFGVGREEHGGGR